MFYCDFRDQQEQTSTNIVGAILKQLLVRGEVLEHVQKAYQKAKREVGGRGLRHPDMVRMLKQAVVVLPRVFICIDALDECPPQASAGTSQVDKEYPSGVSEDTSISHREASS